MRRWPLETSTHAYTEYLVQMVKDFRRTIDYLETRKEIDSRKLAFYGMSWGGWLGAIIPAVEDRLAVSVLSAGAVAERAARPEVRTINYVTRVKIPTLMLNGKYDNAIDSRIRPMFELLGTPAEHKRLMLYDTDHIPPKNEYIKETQAWLDKYLGRCAGEDTRDLGTFSPLCGWLVHHEAPGPSSDGTRVVR